MVTTYNLSAFLVSRNGAVRQALADNLSSGERITGSLKLAQRYVCRLMTLRGSIPYLPNHGCNFIAALRVTGMATESDVFTAFSAAQIELGPSLRSEENAEDPTNERFGKAILNSVTLLADDTLELDVSVYSLAGNPTTVKIPLSFRLQ
jgi:hypothetical protein